MEIKLNYYLITIILLTLMPGCSALNYGYSNEEWNKLTEVEQTNIKNEYQEIIDSRKDQEHNKIIEARDQQVIDVGVNPMGRRY